MVKHHETFEHLPFDATISALDAETMALGARAEFPAISGQSFQQYRRLQSWYNSADV